MSLAPRQQNILELVRERGYVSIDELARHFAVTPQTIRRDINQLAEQGLLRRTHGGAASEASSIQNTAYAMRADQMRDEKQRIADEIGDFRFTTTFGKTLSKLVRRGVSLKNIDFGEKEPKPSGKEYVLAGPLKEGIDQENAKKISKIIRDEGPKGIKAQIQGDELRVSSKSRDDLQAVQRALKAADDIDAAMKIVEGTARSMGITTE